MAKMMRSTKKFARCHSAGHGQRHIKGMPHGCVCEVNDEIQGTAITRAEDKRMAEKDISEQIALLI